MQEAKPNSAGTFKSCSDRLYFRSVHIPLTRPNMNGTEKIETITFTFSSQGLKYNWVQNKCLKDICGVELLILEPQIDNSSKKHP